MTVEDRNIVFDRFYQQSGRKMRNWFLSLFSNHSEFDDMMQIALIHVYENLHRFDRSRGKLETWAFKIARNKCIDFFRQTNILKNKIKYVANINDFDFLPQTNMGGFIEEDEYNRMLEVIEALDIRKKRIIKMHYYQHIGFIEIAKEMNINYNTMKAITVAARREVRSKI